MGAMAGAFHGLSAPAGAATRIGQIGQAGQALGAGAGGAGMRGAPPGSAPKGVPGFQAAKPGVAGAVAQLQPQVQQAQMQQAAPQAQPLQAPGGMAPGMGGPAAGGRFGPLLRRPFTPQGAFGNAGGAGGYGGRSLLPNGGKTPDNIAFDQWAARQPKRPAPQPGQMVSNGWGGMTPYDPNFTGVS